MFTSRPSDPRTVLLWGERWWLPDRGPSAPIQNVAHAAELLAEFFAEEPKPVRLRLIYQPDTLESVAVACPQGTRPVVAACLAAEYPALAHPDRAWGHEPILPTGDGFSTIIHFETEPQLLDLATRLARLGLAVDSAWPLATFLHALPDEWTDSGAVTVVAAQAGRAVVYHHPADATRAVHSWHGDSALTDAGQWLAAILAENPGEPVLLVCSDTEVSEALASFIGEGERPNLESLSLDEAIGRRVTLPRYHPAQLLPRPPTVTVQRLAVAASIALLCAAGWAGFTQGRDWLAVRTELDGRQARLGTLRAEAAHLGQNAAEIASLRSLFEGGAGGAPCGALLRALSIQPPAEVVLTSLRIARKDFEVSGWVAPTAPAGLLERWRQAIAPAGSPWTVSLHPSPNGAFTASGKFVP